ncbi:hypothetical protein PLICRDRAFT_180590 [Plicaturopsis crispa FD-325 SS-3]|uniref:Uncharacterized protein n=1 Tax=Plicaturopsis crispa FD-325 SS-3 TaxID=944288 RepID=A0A0C9T1W7_PLICR|nr:hypothetical protein PLICRDRAFT_180590 [Plicaturopsis crispa FD-325 SS-3]
MKLVEIASLVHEEFPQYQLQKLKNMGRVAFTNSVIGQPPDLVVLALVVLFEDKMWPAAEKRIVAWGDVKRRGHGHYRQQGMNRNFLRLLELLRSGPGQLRSVQSSRREQWRRWRCKLGWHTWRHAWQAGEDQRS